jgi:hypothetical protein
MMPFFVARVVVFALVVASAGSCGPTMGELPPECPDEEPYPLECQSAYRELCESRTTMQDCAGTPTLDGGLSLSCRWIIPMLVVLEAGECLTSDAPPRCIGMATPGDVGCSPHYDRQDDASAVLLLASDCYPMGWQECGTAHAPPECGCVL